PSQLSPPILFILTHSSEISTLSLHDALPIFGDYVGSGGRLLLRSVLASDGAPSDRLVLSGGFASGGTSIEATNVGGAGALTSARSEEHTSELQSRENLVCRLLLEKKKYASK